MTGVEDGVDDVKRRGARSTGEKDGVADEGNGGNAEGEGGEVVVAAVEKEEDEDDEEG